MTAALIQRALSEHRAGRLSQAKTLYEQALAENPRDPDALHLLGVLALQSGEPERAIALIERAIGYLGANPAFHSNLGQAYLAAQRLAEAEAAFRRAAALDPHEPQFALDAATCVALRADARAAEREFRAVAERHPGFAPARVNLARALCEQGRHEEAAEQCRRALALDPALAEAHNGLGAALHALERFAEAEQAFRRALALDPASPAAHWNLASVLIDRGRFAEAAAAARGALARFPDSADLHLVLGAALAYQGKMRSALEPLGMAARLAPDHARALWGYGLALVETGASEEGLRWLERALERAPDSHECRAAISAVRLSLGDFERGWADHGSRPARLAFAQKLSDLALDTALPENLSGKRVGLLREQGLGDELFFLRFAPALKARGARIVYRANPKIASILARVPVLDRVIAGDEPLPAADHVLLIGDLPLALRAFDAAPALALEPLEAQRDVWARRLAALGPPPYLGITWRAGTAPERQRGTSWLLHKEIALERLAVALRGVRATLVSLQRHPQRGETERLAALLGRPVHDWGAVNEDLEAMLALLALLDDYVGVSNTNMHLRAGVGKTARVLVPRPAEWRWLVGGEESPWFPGFRIYRQGADGDWDEALARLAQDLIARFGARAP